MKMILGRVLAVTVLALAVGTPALAQGKSDSAPKGGYSKGGDSKGGYENDSFTVPEPGTLALLGLGVGGIVFFALRRKQ